MVSVIGDVVMPSAIIIPRNTPCPSVSGATVRGQLNLSGAKLYLFDGDGWKLITSA